MLDKTDRLGQEMVMVYWRYLSCDPAEETIENYNKPLIGQSVSWSWFELAMSGNKLRSVTIW
jgi:hypothetical protein